MFDVKKIREMFPIYQNHPDLVYLDTGATSLKPKCVLDKMNEYYEKYGVNIHRGVYRLSYEATEAYDEAREKVSKFLNASFSEIVFKRNVSEALNFIALTYGEKYLKEGDVVITSELEHHSSVLPWMKLCERNKATLRYVKLNEEGRPPQPVLGLLNTSSEKQCKIASTLILTCGPIFHSPNYKTTS